MYSGAGVIKVIMNFHCRGRVPVKESAMCVMISARGNGNSRVTSLSWRWQLRDINISNVEGV